MPSFFAFGPEPDGRKQLINIDQIREIIVTASDRCSVRFSETHKLEFVGQAAIDLLKAVIKHRRENGQ